MNIKKPVKSSAFLTFIPVPFHVWYFRTVIINSVTKSTDIFFGLEAKALFFNGETSFLGFGVDSTERVYVVFVVFFFLHRPGFF